MICPSFFRLLLGITFFTALAACAPTGSKPTTVLDLLHQLPFWNTEPKADTLRQQISDDLQNQRPDLALDRLQVFCADGGMESDFAVLYPATINALLDQADAADTDPGQAGALYRLARQGLPMDLSLQRDIRLSATEIDQKIDQCANELMQLGLKLYRNGQFDAALDTWNQISTFHPEHRPSQIAMKITRTQLRSLEQISKNNRN